MDPFTPENNIKKGGLKLGIGCYICFKGKASIYKKVADWNDLKFGIPARKENWNRLNQKIKQDIKSLLESNCFSYPEYYLCAACFTQLSKLKRAAIDKAIDNNVQEVKVPFINKRRRRKLPHYT